MTILIAIPKIENRVMRNSSSPRKAKRKIVPLRLMIAVVALLTCVCSKPTTAMAQSLTVTVFKDGNPLANAAVCVGSKQEKALFGTFSTDEYGKVTISDLPNGKMLVTVNQANAGAQLVFVQNVSHQDLFLRIPNEANSVRCPQ